VDRPEMTEVQAYVELERARALVIDCCIKADKPEMHNRIAVEWDARLTTTMGMCFTDWGRGTADLTLNPHLWARATEADRRETTIHEAAHAIVNLTYRRQVGHGAEWKAMMRHLGCHAADRCHSVSTAGLRRKAPTFLLPCPRCGTPVRMTARERAGVQTGTKGRYHPTCGYSFTPADALRMEAQ
jgi:predicted SprT family Zn-dependent metalloprotease